MRLTKKIKVVSGINNKGIEDAREVIAISDKKLAEEKLFALEDIEDELGIDLVTLFKALKNGFYGKDIIDYKHDCLFASHLLDLKHKRFYLKDSWEGPGYIYRFKDYGKTWALTKEELE